MILIALTTVVAWVGIGVLYVNTNPDDGGFGILLVFYLALFAGLAGVLTLLGVLFRVYIVRKKDVVQREVRIAFRHAILLSFTGVVALVFSTQGYLHWWVFLIILLLVSCVEYIFLLKESAHRN